MRQTVNPGHLPYNNNRLHKQIVWAPCWFAQFFSIKTKAMRGINRKI